MLRETIDSITYGETRAYLSTKYWIRDMEGGKKRRYGVVEQPNLSQVQSSPKRSKVLNEQKLSFTEWSPEDVQDYFIRKNMISVASIMKGM